MNRALAPGTIDEFVKEFLKGLVAPATARTCIDFLPAGSAVAVTIRHCASDASLTASW
jgi:hypothetical protein